MRVDVASRHRLAAELCNAAASQIVHHANQLTELGGDFPPPNDGKPPGESAFMA
jgi:hypothetical protein